VLLAVGATISRQPGLGLLQVAAVDEERGKSGACGTGTGMTRHPKLGAAERRAALLTALRGSEWVAGTAQGLNMVAAHINILVVIFLEALPALLLCVVWGTVLRSQNSAGPSHDNTKWFLAITSLSFLWFAISGFLRTVIGPDYSTRRYGTIGANLAANVALAVFTLFGKHPLRRRIAFSMGVVAFDWLFAWAMSSVI
jgi:hypothetical protein